MAAGLHDQHPGKDAAVTDSYEVYSPGATTDATGAGTQGGSWHVAVEYSNQGDAKPPTVVQVDGTVLASRDAALAAAEKAAFRYEPPDPFSPRGRQVFRDGPDAFLVIIEGAMTTFHMSVRVVRHVGNA